MSDNSDQAFEVLVAVLIALSSLIIAFISWRAFAAGNASGDADFAGMSAMLAAEETRATNAILAYESYGAYLTYRQHRELAMSLQDALKDLPELSLEAAALRAQLDLAKVTSAIQQQRFSRRFVQRDGSYDIDKQLSTLYADRAQQRNLNAAPSFAEADRLRLKVSWLQGTVIPLTVSLIFFTLAEALSRRLRWLMLSIGALLLLGGTIAFLYFELTL
ncbi:MAG: hypothetical protein RML95_04955 [Anaerolineae bacterium]|nr:hypothetical protein [Anaerolineae bacterium]MDW8298666.1 hypothetical protein [Anaerolineae bacterium]